MADAHARKAQLEKELATVQASLVELINRDYAQFVSLSSDLVGIDATVDQLQKPLKAMLKDVEAVEHELDAELHTLQQQIQRRRQIKQEKSTLQNVLSLAAALDKLDKLIQPLRAQQEAGSAVAVNQLERVATEFTHVSCYATRCRHTDQFSHFEPRVRELQSWIEAELDTRLRAAITDGDTTSVMAVLRIHHLIGRMEGAHSVICQRLFAPAAANVHQRLGAVTSENIEEFYQALLEVWRVGGECVRGSPHLPDDVLLTRAYLPAVVPTATAATERLVSVVHPDFRQNYMHTRSFLDRLEKECPGLRRNWRTSSQAASLLNAWDIRSYAALRRNEIAGDVENALEGKACEVLDPDTISFPPFASLSTPAARTAAAALCLTWSPRVFVTQTHAVAWSLSVQIVLRLEAHVRSLCRDSNTSGDKDGGSSSSSAGDLAALQASLTLVFEATQLADKLPAFLEEVVLPAVEVEDIASLQDDMAAAADELRTAMRDARDAHLNAMARAASTQAETGADLLRQDLLRVYKTPTAPSPNVDKLCSPLAELQSALSSRVEPAEAAAMVEGAAAAAATAYHDSVRKWFDSKNAKLKQQLKLDLEEIVHRIRSLDAEPTACDAWQTLVSTLDTL